MDVLGLRFVFVYLLVSLLVFFPDSGVKKEAPGFLEISCLKHDRHRHGWLALLPPDSVDFSCL